MKKAIPAGIDNFKDLMDGDFYYVDKTQVIEELLTRQKFGTILFPRPRRFGKSLFISMLDNFFNVEKKEENKSLFEGLYISKSTVYKDNLNQFPVIHLDFKSLKSESFEETYAKVKTIISNLYKQHKHVIEILDNDEKKIWKRIESKEGNQEDYEYSLSNLCLWLERYYQKKVIVLIDEYDVPMNSGYNHRYYEKIMNIIRPMFSNAFKGNDSLKMGILTGVLRIGGESLFSDFNNPMIYDIMDNGYNDYFGFTKDETKELLSYYDMEYTDEVKDYYDGYNFNGTHIYNPWSILNYVQKKELKPYWVHTGSNTLIRNLLSEIEMQNKYKIEKLLLGKSVAFVYNPRLSYNLLNSKDLNSVLNLMLVSGYLTLDYKEDGGYTYFKVPNKEVRQDLCDMIEEVMFDQVITTNDDTLDFIKSLLNDNKVSAEESLNKLIMSASYNVNKEAFYQGYVLSVFDTFLNQGQYITNVEDESGYGRSDILVRKKDKSVGLIIEIKRATSDEEMESVAESALEQVRNQKYKMDLEREGVKNVYEYAVVFYGRKAIVR